MRIVLTKTGTALQTNIVSMFKFSLKVNKINKYKSDDDTLFIFETYLNTIVHYYNLFIYLSKLWRKVFT